MAPQDDDPDDPKVKQLLNPTTEADLARWFSLPSFHQLAEQPQPEAPADPEMEAKIKRRDTALANVDPKLLDAISLRNDRRGEVSLFEAKIDVVVDPEMGTYDRGMVERVGSIADPRDVELPPGIDDALEECTPQALLRDLHRAELYFDKTFQVVDVAAEQRFDIVAAVAAAMATNWKLPRLDVAPVTESLAIFAEMRAERRRPWVELLPKLHKRRVRE